MIKEFKNIIKVFFALSIGTVVFISCEPEADELGKQFFQDGTAVGTETSYDVIAYNLFNKDTIQTSSSQLVNATLGAFDESNFGMQKSSYVTQVRLNSYNPDFGANAKVDSVVLEMKPLYQTAADSIKTTTDENYVYPDGAVAAKKVVTNYPVIKYGKYKINGQTPGFTIRVDEVNEFLNSTDAKFFSDKQVALGTSLGTKTFDGYLRAIKITKDTDNSELFSREAGLRVPLNADFFQQKIVDKKGSFELADAASFIRYFKGLRISVDENDGYMMSFDPNGITTTIYYKYDKTENSTVTRTSSSFTLNLGSSNVHFNQIQYNRPSTFTDAISNINTTTGDAKLYVQGMGGPGAEIKIPASTIANLRDLYNTKKIGIMAAKVRLYTDKTVWTSNYAKPTSFVASLKGANAFLADVTAFQYNANYIMVKPVDLDKNPAYYDIDITQTITNVIKNEASDYLEKNPLIVNVGSFRTSTSTSGAATLLGFNYTTRAYTPNRVVLVGSDPSNTQYKAQLKVIYSNK